MEIIHPTNKKKYYIDTNVGISILRNFIKKFTQNSGSAVAIPKEPVDSTTATKSVDPEVATESEHERDLTRVEFIKGPVSFHSYKFSINDFDKNIILFGDYHTHLDTFEQNKKGIYINDFIEHVIKKSSKCIDFFLENIVYHKQIGGYSPIKLLRSHFYRCANHTTEKCQHDNLRLHNFDLRFSLPVSARIKSWAQTKLNYILNKFSIPLTEKINKKNWVKFILGFEISDDLKENMENELDNSRILLLKTGKKCWNTIHHPIDCDCMTEKLDLRYHYYTSSIIQKSYIKMIKDIEFPKDFFETFYTIYGVVDKTNIPKQYNLIFTDFYLLCRIFTKFETNKNKIERSPVKCSMTGDDNYITPKYIFVFGGNHHIRNIKLFLEFMFDIEPLYSTTDSHIMLKRKIPDIAQIFPIIDSSDSDSDRLKKGMDLQFKINEDERCRKEGIYFGAPNLLENILKYTQKQKKQNKIIRFGLFPEVFYNRTTQPKPINVLVPFRNFI